MKNKKLKYVLIPLVIIVWGLIFYKVFSYSNDDGPVVPINNNTNIQSSEILEKDSFELVLKYSDPFLKKNRAIRTRDNTVSVTANAQTSNNPNQQITRNGRRQNNRRQAAAPVFKPTEISYGGEIINNNSKQITAVIKVAGKNKLLSDGDITGNVEIVRIFNDSIHIIDQGKERTVFKK